MTDADPPSGTGREEVRALIHALYPIPRDRERAGSAEADTEFPFPMHRAARAAVEQIREGRDGGNDQSSQEGVAGRGDDPGRTGD